MGLAMGSLVARWRIIAGVSALLVATAGAVNLAEPAHAGAKPTAPGPAPIVLASYGSD